MTITVACQCRFIDGACCSAGCERQRSVRRESCNVKRFEKRVLARPTFHHHGVGNEGATRNRACGITGSNSSFPQLCPELRVHRHLLEQSSLDRETARHVNGPILWANLHLLFWLSLIPFATGWMGENHFAPWPVALYGAVLLFAGTAYFILTKTLIARHGNDSTLAT